MGEKSMTGQILDRGETKRGHSWLLRVYLGEEKGKRIYRTRTIHGNHKTAQRELRRFISELENGSFSSSERYDPEIFIAVLSGR